MRTRAVPFLLATLLLAPTLGGCQKFTARTHFKQGNQLYRNEKYEAAVNEYQAGLKLDPEARQIWRSVGLASMVLYKPGDETKSNLEWAKTSLDAFEKYKQYFPDDPKTDEYIITTLVNMQKWDDAIARLKAKATAKPEIKNEIDGQIFSIMLRADRIEAAYDHVLKTGGAKPDPERLYTVGVNCWSKSYRDPTLSLEARAKMVELGMTALTAADRIKPEDFQTMVYINLLYREKAKLETDPYVAQDYYTKAQEWLDRAKAVRERQKPAAAKPAAS